MSKIKYSLFIKIVVVLAMVCILLPFASVSCGSDKIDTYSGIDLVRGIDLSEQLSSVNVLTAPEKAVPAVTLITLALVLGVIAFIASFYKNKIGYVMTAASSGVALLAVILSAIAIQNGFQQKLDYIVSKKYTIDAATAPTLSFGIGMYLMIALFALTFVLAVLACIFRKEFKEQLTLANKRAVAGYIFIIPFILGFLFFFLKPLLTSLEFSLSTVTPTASGYTIKWAGLDNFNRALFIDPSYSLSLGTTIGGLLVDLPLIVIFSFFAATLLNKAFFGRGLARSILFMPVILTSGVIIGLEASDALIASISGSFTKQVENSTSSVMKAFELKALLQSINLPTVFITYITGAVDRLYDIVTASGVQIMIFLAALQSIPRSLYEASSIEGATSWESFWKITLPMVSPYIVVNTVYTIIDSFTKSTNTLITYIKDMAFLSSKYDLSSAMSWVYFLAVLAILGVVVGIMSRFIFYYDER